MIKASRRARSVDDDFPSLPSGTKVEVGAGGSLKIDGVGEDKFTLEGCHLRDLARELAKDHGLELEFVLGRIEI